jgi:hypothetical protein
MKKLFWERMVWVWLLCFPLAFAGSFTTTIGAAQINAVLASPGPIGSITPNTGNFISITVPSVVIDSGAVTSTGGTATFGIYHLNSNILFSATAPTIASGFGTSPNIALVNGTASFRVNVGTGGTANTGVISMPATTNEWSCFVEPALYGGLPQANGKTLQSQTTSTSISLTNYAVSTGAPAAWNTGYTLYVHCIGT